MQRNAYLMLALAASISLAGCGSDAKSEDPKPQTKADMLAAHEWILNTATVTVAGQTVDALAVGLLEDCEQDNFYRFTTSNTFTLNENVKVCTPSSAESGTWAFNADQTKLLLTGQGSMQESTITELTDRALKLSSTEDFAGTPITIDVSFKVK